MLKVMTILGTRPEIIKLARVLAELETHTQHILVHTGQNYDYELNQIFFDELGVKKPDYFLAAVGDSVAKTIGNIIANADEVIVKENPDAILVYGDTNSCLAVIAAKRRKIPIFHMEAGNRCFDQRVPEEINRKIVDHTSDINMTLTEHARRYLLAEGIRPETIFKTGSSMKEIFTYYHKQIESSDILTRLGLTDRGYFVVSAHREENIDDETNFENLVATLNYLGDKYKRPLIFSTHPRTMKRIVERGIEFNEYVRVMKPLGFFDYNKLQISAYCVISDSGTVFEESSLLRFPAITIRNAHERPEGMDSGTLIMSGLEKEDVEKSIEIVVGDYIEGYSPKLIPDFDVDDVSKKVLRIIMSYTRYIKRTVWKV
ncbi:MAG: UDP-N-acetylglucosamine 2-epimerase [Spirochaetes bacterium GWB1_48_6]|nr:MAG: UDP-N-acetylglucosamine 2-epimerase [Spirochaetes bacterium GWB1_48_6]